MAISGGTTGDCFGPSAIIDQGVVRSAHLSEVAEPRMLLLGSMTRAPVLMAFILFACGARGADAADATIHSDPATHDNVRVYAFVDAPVVTLVLDGGGPSRFEGMSVVFTRLEAGPHKATITLPDGSQASLAFALSADALVESKGHRWWCLMAGRTNGKLTMLQPTNAQCKKIADAGPD